MKTGLFGQQLTIMEELKTATYLAHARLQTQPFFEAMTACQLPLESYVGMLRGLAVIHGVLESLLESQESEVVQAVWREEMKKTPALQKDLAYFEPRCVADIRESVDQAQEIAGKLRLYSQEQPASLLGCLYVLEGSTLGSAILKPRFARAFVLDGVEGLAYLNNYGAEVHTQWSAYQKRMNSLPLSASERDNLIKASVDFMGWIESLYKALYPFKPESKVHSITSINFEAGRHPVPTDEREVKASLNAAEKCWEQYPYYEARYGERGRRFARSDSAWLATLCQFEAAQIRQQVKWLARVLASRGMPSLLLEQHLMLLEKELAAAIPEKAATYGKLRDAALELRRERERVLGAGIIESISKEFDEAVGAEWVSRYGHAGELLACALVDECLGCVGARDNLQKWMTDTTRFPEKWVVAVMGALDQIRQHSSKNK